MIATPMASAGVARLYGIGACHAPLMMISGFSMTFMLSAPLGNPMMDASSFSIQKMLIAFSMFT
jgi:hypothetical protein